VCLVRTFVVHRDHFASTLRFLASLGSLAWLALGIQWLRGIRNIPVLKDLLEADRVDRNPALSVILAARDEERPGNTKAWYPCWPKTIQARWRS
jgi:hypothetical protein